MPASDVSVNLLAIPIRSQNDSEVLKVNKFTLQICLILELWVDAEKQVNLIRLIAT